MLTNDDIKSTSRKPKSKNIPSRTSKIFATLNTPSLPFKILFRNGAVASLSFAATNLDKQNLFVFVNLVNDT